MWRREWQNSIHFLLSSLLPVSFDSTLYYYCGAIIFERDRPEGVGVVNAILGRWSRATREDRR